MRKATLPLTLAEVGRRPRSEFRWSKSLHRDLVKWTSQKDSENRMSSVSNFWRLESAHRKAWNEPFKSGIMKEKCSGLWSCAWLFFCWFVTAKKEAVSRCPELFYAIKVKRVFFYIVPDKMGAVLDSYLVFYFFFLKSEFSLSLFPQQTFFSTNVSSENCCFLKYFRLYSCSSSTATIDGRTSHRCFYQQWKMWAKEEISLLL